MKHKIFSSLIKKVELSKLMSDIEIALDKKKRIIQAANIFIRDAMLKRDIKEIYTVDLQEIGFNYPVPTVGPEIDICGETYVSVLDSIELGKNMVIIGHGEEEANKFCLLSELDVEDIKQILLYFVEVIKLVDEGTIEIDEEGLIAKE